jgi:hypothetical protein
MTLLNGTLTAYEPGLMPKPKPSKFVCPECGNRDLDMMSLILVDLDWCRYGYVHADDDGMPAFTYNKSVYTEASAGHSPSMECNRTWTDADGWHMCHGTWSVEWDDFNLE